jgi:murein DD-endopeptidase MepM/ murein hydrolase activator NlpD
MNKFKTSIFILFSALPFIVSAQKILNNTYPQNYFEWPVKTTVGIVANFGELRPNHYHMGLDCRTDGRVNVPIVAAADGYIAKIHVDPTGFGRTLYINHPNGLTTLYAHLNTLNPALEKYLIEQQYLQKKWKVDVIVPAGLFAIKKGEFIAYSGNTGGSQGPHLHFEIRDTKSENVLNPLLFGLPIEDNVPPEIFRIAVYDSRVSVYEQAPKIYIIKKYLNK